MLILYHQFIPGIRPPRMCPLVTSVDRAAEHRRRVTLSCRAANFNNDSTKDASSDAATNSNSADASAQRPIPWTLTFDLRERDTIWTDQNKARLVQIFAARKLGMDEHMLSYRLRQLTLLLPDLSERVSSMKPDLLADILRDPVIVAERCVGLRDGLPFANVSKLVAGDPALLLEEVEAVVRRVQSLAEVLSIDERHAQELATQEPRFLDVEGVLEVLEEMERLMPKANSKMVLLRDPSWLMRVERGVKRLGQG
ncbi:g4529 [Coccomyxa elongata]